MEKEKTGLLLKRWKRTRKPDFKRFTNAMLREASKDYEGYYLKVDLFDCSSRQTAQIYLYLDARDVKRVIEE